MEKRPIFQNLMKRLKEPRRFIQVLLGPRQVGKTTLALQIAKKINTPTHYITADMATLQDLPWLEMQWETARQKLHRHSEVLFIIDEVQKIPHWSDVIKKLWDEDTRLKNNIKVLILGSSPWLVQKGLTESMAGRFEVIAVPHWSFEEMKRVFHWDLDEFIYFGGYPGAAPLADKDDVSRWMNYINDALIETTISRDILLMTQVNKPALLRRLFQLGCQYSGQILSFQKMTGQLQDAGNTTTLAHYLELLSGASVLTGIEKFSNQHFRRRASSPKFQVFSTALMSAQSGKTFHEAKKDPGFWGRLTESSIGAHLLAESRTANIEVYYWREDNKEVDFVLKKGDQTIAIEVKSGFKKESLSGMTAFAKAFHPQRLLLIGSDGIPVEEFLMTTAADWFRSQ